MLSFSKCERFHEYCFSFFQKNTIVNKGFYKMCFHFQNVRGFVSVVFHFSEKFPVFLSKKMTNRGRGSKIVDSETTEFIDGP